MNSIVFAVVPSTVEPASLPLLGLGLVTLTMGVINDALCESQTGLPPAIRGLSAERNNFALRESFLKVWAELPIRIARLNLNTTGAQDSA